MISSNGLACVDFSFPQAEPDDFSDSLDEHDPLLRLVDLVRCICIYYEIIIPRLCRQDSWIPGQRGHSLLIKLESHVVETKHSRFYVLVHV